jgi:hypothetical protein
MTNLATIKKRALTIEEVLAKQDASDMFFNDERVTSSYEASFPSDTLEEFYSKNIEQIKTLKQQNRWPIF